jgi:hypothetical protein
MNILDVTQRSQEGGIELADLDSVKAALRLYAMRGIRISDEAMLAYSNEPSGGLGLAMRHVFNARPESGFMQELLREIDKVTDQHSFSRSFGYDGIGPFFKTNVDVSKVKIGTDKFIYLLSLDAAHAGDELCSGLAEAIGASRALWYDMVSIEVAPSGRRFEVNFDFVVQRLASIGISSFTGKQIADQIMSRTRPSSGRSAVVTLHSYNDIALYFGILSYSVEEPFDPSTMETTWSQSGPIISGQLGQLNDGRYTNPRLYAEISIPDRWSLGRKPIINPTLKQTIHDQSLVLASAFQ